MMKRSSLFALFASALLNLFFIGSTFARAALATASLVASNQEVPVVKTVAIPHQVTPAVVSVTSPQEALSTDSSAASDQEVPIVKTAVTSFQAKPVVEASATPQAKKSVVKSAVVHQPVVPVEKSPLQAKQKTVMLKKPVVSQQVAAVEKSPVASTAQPPAVPQSVAPVKASTVASHEEAPIVLADQIVVVVDHDIITQRQFDERLHLITQRFQQQKMPLPPPAQMQGQVLNQMVIESLQLQKAKELGIIVTDQIVRSALVKIAQAQGLNVPAYRQEIEKKGMDWSSFLRNLKTEMILSQLREQVIDRKIAISDAEVMAYLAKQQGEQGISLQQDVHVEHIFIAAGQGAEQKAQAVLEKALATPAKFKTLAKQYSMASDAQQGGDLGYHSPADLSKEVVLATTKIRPGEVYSQVIAVPLGYEIIKLIGRQESQGGGSMSAPVITQTHARHILLRVNGQSDEQVLAKIQQIRQQWVDGADFAKLAQQYSQDASAKAGGDLGWISPGQTVPAFEQAMNALNVDEVSQPVRTQFGYHLIEVLARRKTKDSLEHQMALARQAIGQRKSSEQYLDWLNQLRNAAFIQYYLNGVPVMPNVN